MSENSIQIRAKIKIELHVKALSKLEDFCNENGFSMETVIERSLYEFITAASQKIKKGTRTRLDWGKEEAI